MRLLCASGLFSIASVAGVFLFSPAQAQGTKLEGGVDSLAPATTLMIRQGRPSNLQSNSSIKLNRLVPREVIMAPRGISLHAGVNQDSLSATPVLPIGLKQSLDLARTNLASPLRSSIELKSKEKTSDSLPILKGHFPESLDFVPANYFERRLVGKPLNLSLPNGSKGLVKSNEVLIQRSSPGLLHNHGDGRSDIHIDRLMPNCRVSTKKVTGLPVKFNSLPSKDSLPLRPVMSDFIEISRIKPSQMSDILVTSVRLRTKSPDIRLKSLSVDIKLSKAPISELNSELGINWDSWYEAFNKELAVNILECANEVGNPSGCNKVLVSVAADGNLSCKLLSACYSDFDALILAAYRRINHSPFLKFPSGSSRKSIEFSVEHVHEEQGPVDEVQSSSIKGDSE